MPYDLGGAIAQPALAHYCDTTLGPDAGLAAE